MSDSKNHWHHVANPDREPRIALVIDRIGYRNNQKRPFQVCPNGPGCDSRHD